jgi:hypothetical protein
MEVEVGRCVVEGDENKQRQSKSDDAGDERQ